MNACCMYVCTYLMCVVIPGLCRHSMVALRVIPVEELKPFYQLKNQGHTGKELVKAMVPKVPRSRTRQVEDDQMDTDEPKVSPEGLTSEEQAMMKELLADIYQAKVGAPLSNVLIMPILCDPVTTATVSTGAKRSSPQHHVPPGTTEVGESLHH